MLGFHAQMLLLHKGCCLRSLLKALTRMRAHATLPRGMQISAHTQICKSPSCVKLDRFH